MKVGSLSIHKGCVSLDEVSKQVLPSQWQGPSFLLYFHLPYQPTLVRRRRENHKKPFKSSSFPGVLQHSHSKIKASQARLESITVVSTSGGMPWLSYAMLANKQFHKTLMYSTVVRVFNFVFQFC